MVILILLLWSLCAIIINRFLVKKGMKVAAAVYTALYVYLTVWVFVISYMDFVHFGADADSTAALFVGDFYRSFAGLTQMLDRLPSDLLVGIVFSCIAIAISVVSILIIGGIHLYRAIAKVLQGKPLPKVGRLQHTKRYVRSPFAYERIYLRYCRLNN